MDDNDQSIRIQAGALTVETLMRFKELAEDERGVIDDFAFNKILNNLAHKAGIKVKKLEKQALMGAGNNQGNGKTPVIRKIGAQTALSYQLSQQIWGAKCAAPQEIVNGYLKADVNSVFFDASYDWDLFWLNGFSVQQMIAKFPDKIHLASLEKYPWFKQTARPGYYLISRQNKLINRSQQYEKHSIPEDCERLEGNLLLELLIGLEFVGAKLPEGVFYRTNFEDKHQRKFCLGKNGRFRFTAAQGGKYKKAIHACLAKSLPELEVD